MNYADFQFLQFEHKPNGVLLITLNRPEVMNATNARLHWELTKIWGVVNDESLGDKIKITVIATGFEHVRSAEQPQDAPVKVDAVLVPVPD